MNQITQYFQGCNARMARLEKAIEGENKPDMEVLLALEREAELMVKGFNVIASFYATASKNKRVMIGLDKMNIMDETTAIDMMLGDPEVDKVKCPDQNMLILRADCLDYSGSHDTCLGCEIGIATKNKLLAQT